MAPAPRNRSESLADPSRTAGVICKGLHQVSHPNDRHLRVKTPRSPVETEMPESLWDAIGEAAALADSLERDGLRLRYDIEEATGQVVASLCDLAGRRIRVLPLTEALGVSDGPAPSISPTSSEPDRSR